MASSESQWKKPTINGKNTNENASITENRQNEKHRKCNITTCFKIGENSHYKTEEPQTIRRKLGSGPL